MPTLKARGSGGIPIRDDVMSRFQHAVDGTFIVGTLQGLCESQQYFFINGNFNQGSICFNPD